MKSEDTIAAIMDSKAPPKVKEFAVAFRVADTRTPQMSMKMSGYVRKYTKTNWILSICTKIYGRRAVMDEIEKLK